MFTILMICQKNPIVSALCLVASFFGLAGLYVMLDAHFVATLQILVYAGAIMVLFIFVIMLLNLKDTELSFEKIGTPQVLSIFAGLGFFGFAAFKFMQLPVSPKSASGFLPVTEGFGTVENLGTLMFGEYVIAFEVIGILLLVGIVGAILLGQRE